MKVAAAFPGNCNFSGSRRNRAGAIARPRGHGGKIRKIRAIDNHSHPPRVVADGERDDEFDALPCDPLEPTAPNTMTRPENPQYLAAWTALWGYAYDDRSDAHLKPN